MTAGVAITVPELIKLQHAAQGLALASHRRVINIQAGGYQSRLRGRGVDFDEVRNYQPGDDIRMIDWRVTARTGKPQTKLFREERERKVLFMVDYSASMRFGTKVAFKSVIAAQTAAILAWAAIAGGDQVGGLVFAEHFHQALSPNPGAAGILPLLNALAVTADPRPLAQTFSFMNALNRLQHVASKGSLIFIISDFYQLDEPAEKVLGQLRQHNDIAAICIYDPLEKLLPVTSNLYAFTSEQCDHLVINTANASLTQAYTQQFAQRQVQLQRFMRSLTSPLLTVATNELPRKVLAQYWSKRSRG